MGVTMIHDIMKNAAPVRIHEDLLNSVPISPIADRARRSDALEREHRHSEALTRNRNISCPPAMSGNTTAITACLQRVAGAGGKVCATELQGQESASSGVNLDGVRGTTQTDEDETETLNETMDSH